MMNRKDFLLCSILFFASAAQAQTFPDNGGKLKVLVLKESPSMSYRDAKGNLVGFNVDLAKLLCEKLNLVCEIEDVLMTEAVDKLYTGEADFSTISMLPTPERRKKLLFTVPVMLSNAFWVAKEEPMKNSRTFKVTAVNGSTHHAWVLKNAKNYDWSVVGSVLHTDIKKALLDGSADAAVLPFPTAMSIIQDGDLIKAGFSMTHVIDEEELSFQPAVAVNPRRKDLLNSLDAVIREIKINGQLERINTKYFPVKIL